MKCLLCPAEASRAPLCDADWRRWATAPEFKRAEAIVKSGEVLAEKRARAAVMDFVRRVQAENQSAR